MSINRLYAHIVFGLCVLLIAGCDISRYEPALPDKPVRPEQRTVPVGTGDPITLYNCLIWNSDNIDNAYIPLETGIPADAVSESGFFSFVQTNALDGKSCLRPLLEDNVKLPEWGYDNITVYARDSSFRTVKLQVMFRPSEVEKLSEPTSADINDRMSFIFSHAVNPNVDAVGAIKVYPVLQEGVIKRHITVNSEHGQYFSQEHGSSIEEVTENHSHSYGLGGILSIFSGNIGGSIKKSSYNRSEYEYIMGTKIFYASQGALRWNDISPLLCIDRNFNDLINNPGSDNYKRYEDTEAGIFALLQDYGSSIVCTASLGAYGEYVYSRKKNISQHSIAWDLKLGLEKYAVPSVGDTSIFPYLRTLASMGIKVDADLDKMNPAPEKDFSAEFSSANDYKRYLETNKTNVDVFVCGGNSLSVNVSSDLSAFNATDDCRNWIICSYLYEISERDQSSNPNPFRSVSTLVHDTTSVRGKLICDMLRPYQKKDGRWTCKFYDMFEQPKKHEPTPIVLADFRCVLTPVSNGIYPYVGAPKPVMMEGPDGKTRLYHALMTGPWTPNLEQIKMQGYVFDFSFNYSNKKKHDVNFYYALDYSDECDGLTDIIMVMDSQPAGYIRYPEDPSKGQTNGKRYIAVKLGNSSTPAEDKIKSVGLYNAECDNINCIMTASGGGEIPINYTKDEIDDICRMWNGAAEGNKYKFTNKSEGGRDVVKFYTPETGSEYICGAGFGNRNPVMNICWTKIPIKKRVGVEYINNDYPGYYPSEIHEPLVWEADMN